MDALHLIIFNLEEARRRSLKVWRALPCELYNWKPKLHNYDCIEIIHHILEREYQSFLMLQNKNFMNLNSLPILTNDKNLTIDDILKLYNPYHKQFIELIKTINPHDLFNVEVDCINIENKRYLGDFLLRLAYHESFHTGQLVSYLKLANNNSVLIFD
ncbi:DinB family protein [Cytobacillus firmus]|uniref:DinB family protein n=1 Tax=Cytobacillus firmus TaxID=1399 RepID=UPI0018CF2841|nr:DinB family protein [Cytobacillus firmus]MBG9587268.1 hypothetical protein [Cytobacillus firmus]